MQSSELLQRLILSFSKMPGIGEKSATRIAYHLLKMPVEQVAAFSETITQARTLIQYCKQCFTFSDEMYCNICKDAQRYKHTICVVEKPSDIVPIEKMGRYRGTYHVLHGVIAPLDGVGPDQLKIESLFDRLQELLKSDPCEVILATNPSLEGQATAHFLRNILLPLGVRVSQLAYGLAVGSTLEYSDVPTIMKAFEQRLVL